MLMYLSGKNAYSAISSDCAPVARLAGFGYNPLKANAIKAMTGKRPGDLLQRVRAGGSAQNGAWLNIIRELSDKRRQG